jgi:hypothetical protein
MDRLAAFSGKSVKLGNLAEYGMIGMSSKVAYLQSEVAGWVYIVPAIPGSAARPIATRSECQWNTLASSFANGTSAQNQNVSNAACCNRSV